MEDEICTKHSETTGGGLQVSTGDDPNTGSLPRIIPTFRVAVLPTFFETMFMKDLLETKLKPITETKLRNCC